MLDDARDVLIVGPSTAKLQFIRYVHKHELAIEPKIVGVIAQNDDVADGCMAALRAAGMQPGKDVFIAGADGTTGGAEAIQGGRLLSTSANIELKTLIGQTATLHITHHTLGW